MLTINVLDQYHLDPDSDPSFQYVADPDQDSALYIDADPVTASHFQISSFQTTAPHQNYANPRPLRSTEPPRLPLSLHASFLIGNGP